MRTILSVPVLVVFEPMKMRMGGEERAWWEGDGLYADCEEVGRIMVEEERV